MIYSADGNSAGYPKQFLEMKKIKTGLFSFDNIEKLVLNVSIYDF